MAAGNTQPSRIIVEDSSAINLSYTCDKYAKKGTVVKLLNAATVTPVTAATDKCFGVITKGNEKENESVTVSTGFMAIVNVKVTTAVVAGNYARASAFTDNESTFAAVTSGEATGVVLSNASANANCHIGVYRSPVKV